MPQGIIEALRQDHEEFRQMFAQLETATGEQRRDLFHQLLGDLVRHEVSEEEILRPVSKRDAGEEIANARISEESQAEELLKEMENLDTDSAEFTAKLATLRREVEHHAEAEETQEFPKVAQNESPQRLEQMGKVYAAAKKAAPTRPHPSTPNTPVANMLVGPFAAVLDRARDVVRDAMKSAS
jgi:hemerythrin superfamily protein